MAVDNLRFGGNNFKLTIDIGSPNSITGIGFRQRSLTGSFQNSGTSIFPLFPFQKSFVIQLDAPSTYKPYQFLVFFKE